MIHPSLTKTETAPPAQALQPAGWGYLPVVKTSMAGQSQFWFWLALLLHLPLAYAMLHFRMLAVLHALFALVIGLYFLVHDQTSERLVCLCAYIVGAEVLWRMTKAGIFWEYAKLALIVLFILGLLRWGRGKIGVLSLAYLAPLLLSSFYTLEALPLGEARQQISFNLFGHLTLAAGLAFFLTQKVNKEVVQKILRWLILPMAGISFLILVSIQSADFIEFTSESNFVTSGGYGPNQVSAVLGLGALACWLLVLLLPRFSLDRWLLLFLSAGLLIQAVLTFSRGGVLNFLIAALLATMWLIRDESRALKTAFMGVIVVGVIGYMLLPPLNTATGGALEARYQDFSMTNRENIMKLDLNIWREHFWLGVGPGMSSYLRAPFLGGLVAPHTEYTRLLAEHGLFGLWALMLLAGMAIYTFFKAPNLWNRGVVLACFLWALAEMTHAAMRIAAIPFLLALPFVLIQSEEQ